MREEVGNPAGVARAAVQGATAGGDQIIRARPAIQGVRAGTAGEGVAIACPCNNIIAAGAGVVRGHRGRRPGCSIRKLDLCRLIAVGVGVPSYLSVVVPGGRAGGYVIVFDRHCVVGARYRQHQIAALPGGLHIGGIHVGIEFQDAGSGAATIKVGNGVMAIAAAKHVGIGAQPTDQTTWSAIIEGDPIRLVK